MRKRKYDIILWDVDGTLLNFLQSEKWALTETFCSYGIEIDDEIIAVYSAINDSLWKQLERGEISREQVQKGRFVQLFKELMPGGRLEGKKVHAESICKIELTEFQKKFITNLGSVFFYMEDSISLCKKLKEEGFLQYIITNGVEWPQRNKLHLSGFDEVMEELYISEVIGYNKPDVRFFEGCFKQMMKKQNLQEDRIDLRRILVIGDSMTSDMKGAENAGLDSCLYAPGKTTDEKPGNVTYQIASLWDVEELLWQNQKDKN